MLVRGLPTRDVRTVNFFNPDALADQNFNPHLGFRKAAEVRLSQRFQHCASIRLSGVNHSPAGRVPAGAMHGSACSIKNFVPPIRDAVNTQWVATLGVHERSSPGVPPLGARRVRSWRHPAEFVLAAPDAAW